MDQAGVYNFINSSDFKHAGNLDRVGVPKLKRRKVARVNNKEVQLEQVAKAIESFRITKSPPIFELYSALVAMSISVLLLMLPGVFLQENYFYVLMRTVMPQVWWAVVFMVAGIASALGMLLDKMFIRITALLALVVTYGITASFYIVTFPNLAGVLMFWITIFTAASIPMVKYTGLRK